MPPAHPPTSREVDVRGPRAAAWVTSAVVGAAGCLGCELYPTVRRARPARTT